MFIHNHEMNKFVFMIIVDFSLYTFCCSIEFMMGLSHSRHKEWFNNWQNVCSSAYLLQI